MQAHHLEQEGRTVLAGPGPLGMLFMLRWKASQLCMNMCLVQVTYASSSVQETLAVLINPGSVDKPWQCYQTLAGHTVTACETS